MLALATLDKSSTTGVLISRGMPRIGVQSVVANGCNNLTASELSTALCAARILLYGRGMLSQLVPLLTLITLSERIT